jgi:alkaline phosphatase D
VVAVWDDHDVAGNAWRDGAVDHDPDEDGDWGARRAAAVRAYLEWLPVRAPDPSRPDRIYRTIGFGDLATLILLDTRLAGRDRPAAGGNRPVATVLVRDRSLLGDEQRAWLREELGAPVRWRLLGNQVMMAPLRLVHVPRPLHRLVPGLVAGGAGVNAGQWDGYPDERRRLFDHLEGQGLGNVVVLTGDLHSSWAAELTLEPKEPDRTVVGVEFVTPSVTTRSFGEELAPPVPGGRALLRRLIGRQNPHQRFFDLEGHGYLVVDVTHDRVQADWWHVDTVARRSGGERLVASWAVRDGEPRLTEASGGLGVRR